MKPTVLVYCLYFWSKNIFLFCVCFLCGSMTLVSWSNWKYPTEPGTWLSFLQAENITKHAVPRETQKNKTTLMAGPISVGRVIKKKIAFLELHSYISSKTFFLKRNPLPPFREEKIIFNITFFHPNLIFNRVPRAAPAQKFIFLKFLLYSDLIK